LQVSSIAIEKLNAIDSMTAMTNIRP